MKRYKLKRDLPTFKAGEVFEIEEDGSLYRVDHIGNGVGRVMAYHQKTLDKFPNILTDWFEEIKEQTRWKPELGQRYYFLDSNGFAHHSIWADDSIDRSIFEIGNCFQTEEEAERVVEYLKALTVVRGDATSKFVKDGNNWCVYYDTNLNSIHSSISCTMLDNGIFGLPYFATREDAQRSIKLHKNEWLTIFGVKEEVCD